MRRYLKKNFIELTDSIKEMHQVIGGSVNIQELQDFLAQLQQAAISIGEALEGEKEDYSEIVSYLEKYCELVYQYGMCQEEAEKLLTFNQLEEQLEIIRKGIIDEVIEDKLKVAIMPYKADMWTSLASIWEAAQSDSECEVKVIPIPYYKIGNPENIEFVYEGERFPKEVEITFYEDYVLETEYPDMIFIHNPYDGANTLTRVPEYYYSSNLKNYTDKLIYCPYHTIGTFNPRVNGLQFFTPGIRQADYVVAQSKEVKKILESCGKRPERILTFGSPKIDAVVRNEKQVHCCPEGWEAKLAGKKVFLLNTHLSYFQKTYTCTGNMDNPGIRFHQEILDIFLKNKECALIWRPHPLLKSNLSTRLPEVLDFVNDFENQIRNADNGVVDDSADYFSAFYYSNALLSTWSSLINEYMVTGKPVLIFQKRVEEEIEKQSSLKRNVNYFRFGEESLSFEQFRDNVLTGKDPLYEKRIEAVQEAFPNLDGSAGEKIYSFLKGLY